MSEISVFIKGVPVAMGRGPTRRYSTKVCATKAARERDRKYAAGNARGPR